MARGGGRASRYRLCMEQLLAAILLAPPALVACTALASHALKAKVTRNGRTGTYALNVGGG